MTPAPPCFTLEDGLGRLIAGVDEAGRGPLAGSVVAAAVVLDPERPIAGLADSKRLSEQQREALYPVIVAEALAYAVAQASVDEIDRLNILQATLLAMTRAVAALPLQPDFIYVDGNRCPAWRYRSQAVVKGDSRVASVAAASILAKVTRDRELVLLHSQYPGYGFAQHKGYPTELHLQALRALGPSPAHRRSFAPVAAVLQQDPAGG